MYSNVLQKIQKLKLVKNPRKKKREVIKGFANKYKLCIQFAKRGRT